MSPSKPIEVVVIGAGSRGNAYARFALDNPDQMRVVAVAEPDALRRETFANRYSLAPDRCFADWRDLVNAGKLAPAAINATMDRDHYESTMALMEADYEVLLEKPMSPVLRENLRLIEAAESSGRLLQVCHVLRYTPFWQTIREIVQSGRLGDIVSVDHRENLIFWHMAHSFVRGNWRRADTSGPMILTKCCHDFDVLHWILEQPVTHLNSYGALRHFREENTPPGAPLRCIDGCPVADSCKYDAVRLYVHEENWIGRVLTPDSSAGARMEALRTSPYARCVYQADNDVVDHQTVNMLLANNTTVTLTMNGHGFEECRTMRYDGTLGTLAARFSHPHKVTIRHHRTGSTEYVQVPNQASGHGGGDFGVMRRFLAALKGDRDSDLTSARESLESHLLAFAAEQSRLSQESIDMAAFRQAAHE